MSVHQTTVPLAPYTMHVRWRRAAVVHLTAGRIDITFVADANLRNIFAPRLQLHPCRALER